MEPTPASIVIVVFDGLQGLDAVGPFEVFAAANRLAQLHGDPEPYRVALASADGRSVTANSGVGLTVDGSLAECSPGVDTVVVAGGAGVHRAVTDTTLVAEVGAATARARRVASVCTGAFVLAAAGLLDGRRATTHWASSERLACDFPDIAVDDDPIFIRDGHVWTSAGVTAGMDLALALVADDLGDGVAHDVASWLVMFTRRPGGQSQFSASLGARPAARPRIGQLQAWIVDHPTENLTVAALADRAGMSPRHFAREFASECGITPARYVETVRLERARQLLESTDASIDAVARRVGLSGDAVLHRLFRRRLGTTPAAYRAHFAHTD